MLVTLINSHIIFPRLKLVMFYIFYVTTLSQFNYSFGQKWKNTLLACHLPFKFRISCVHVLLPIFRRFFSTSGPTRTQHYHSLAILLPNHVPKLDYSSILRGLASDKRALVLSRWNETRIDVSILERHFFSIFKGLRKSHIFVNNNSIMFERENISVAI